MGKKKPFNLLLEVYVLGIQRGLLGSKGNIPDVIQRDEELIDAWSRKFGYPGLSSFDREDLKPGG